MSDSNETGKSIEPQNSTASIQLSARPSNASIQSAARPSNASIHPSPQPSNASIQPTAPRPSNASIQSSARPSSASIHIDSKRFSKINEDDSRADLSMSASLADVQKVSSTTIFYAISIFQMRILVCNALLMADFTIQLLERDDTKPHYLDNQVSIDIRYQTLTC